MEWSLDRPNRDFQFGRLLAIAEWVEEKYYKKTDEDRTTMAIKQLTRFQKKPLATFTLINTHLERAYLNRVGSFPKKRYADLKEEVFGILKSIAPEEKMWNAPLNEFYLVGYELQKKALHTYKANNEVKEDEEE